MDNDIPKYTLIYAWFVPHYDDFKVKKEGS